jgi:hypothetical protein
MCVDVRAASQSGFTLDLEQRSVPTFGPREPLTPALLAALGGHLDLFLFLHAVGASIEATSREGQRAVDIAFLQACR